MLSNIDFKKWFENYDWEGLIVSVGLLALKVIGIIIAYLIVKKIGQKILDRTFSKVMQRQEISEGRALTLHRLAENVFTYALIFVVTATLFTVFGIPVASLIAGAGIVGLAIGFGAQGLVSDVVTGFFLLLEKQIDVNDYVTVGTAEGIVEAVGLRTTQIRNFNGTVHYIPNREIKSLSNHSRGNSFARLDIGLSSRDADQIIGILKSASEEVASNNSIIVDGPHVLGVQAFGATDMVIRVIAKTQNMKQKMVEDQLHTAITEAFDKEGIDLPVSKSSNSLKVKGQRG